MRKSLFLKLLGGYVLIILALSTLFLVFSFARIRAHYEDTLAGELESLGRVLNIGIRSRLESGATADLDAFVKTRGKEIQARITVVDPEGKVLADSDADPATMENHRYRPEVIEALEGKIGRSRRFSYTVEQNMLYIGLPIESSGRTIGVLRLSYFLKTIDVLLAGLRMTIVRIVLIGALASLLLAFVLSLRIARPIGRLTVGARAMAEGRFETRVVLGHRDEFRDLGDAFNAMSKRIQELFSQVSIRTDELDSIVSSLREGLVVADRDGRIVLVNEVFKNMFGEARPEGRFVWEVIRKPRIQDFVGRTLTSAEPVTGEIELGEKTYFCTGAAMKEEKGILLSLSDITAIRRAEQVRRDFVVNASHELRTPLAAIQGAVEALEDGAGEESRAVIEILKRQVGRLLNIVEDLLKLSALEDRNVPLETREVDVRALAETVLAEFSARLGEKGLLAAVSAPPNLPAVCADPDLLEQALVNLIDNAVKYTDKGRVDIRLDTVGGELRIAVSDTGIGIPAEHLERIFERFYVVDKSRSRKSGGTGLGLSIVKHIAERHGGRVSIESAAGRGTTFTLTIPGVAV